MRSRIRYEAAPISPSANRNTIANCVVIDSFRIIGGLPHGADCTAQLLCKSMLGRRVVGHQSSKWLQLSDADHLARLRDELITLRPLRYFAGEEHNVFLDIARLDAMTGRLPRLARFADNQLPERPDFLDEELVDRS